jgi:broad specificity phosphatase PhoE
MGTLYLIRHGQASLGADDYDQLSPLGQRQSRTLGEYLGQLGLEFEAVLTGTLRRHRQTWEGIAQGAGLQLLPQPWPGLNEYDSHALLHTVHPGPLPRPDSPDRYRQHFRLLRDALAGWMEGTLHPVGMPDFAGFERGVVEVLDHVRQQHSGNVLLVSSGGPIATAVAHVLAASTPARIELNMGLRNTAVTELVFSPKRHALRAFNTLPHLPEPALRDWISYA